MIVNLENIQALLLDKRKSDHRMQCHVVDDQNIKVVSSAELLLGIQINNKHISNCISLMLVGLLRIN